MGSKWNRQHPETLRACHLRKYGIDPAEYERMLCEQGGVCLVCGKPESTVDPRTGRIKRLTVDHDHVTGAVRGLLCRNCNLALGLVDEDEFRLIAMADYLLRARLEEEFAVGF